MAFPIIINIEDSPFIKMPSTIPSHLLKDTAECEGMGSSKNPSRGVGKKRKASSSKKDDKTRPKP